MKSSNMFIYPALTLSASLINIFSRRFVHKFKYIPSNFPLRHVSALAISVADTKNNHDFIFLSIFSNSIYIRRLEAVSWRSIRLEVKSKQPETGYFYHTRLFYQLMLNEIHFAAAGELSPTPQ